MSAIIVPTDAVVTASTNGCCDPVECCDPSPCDPVECCDPCCPPLPVVRSSKARVSRGGGSKHEVNSGASKTVGCKASYQLPTCAGPVKITSSRICKVENHQQVKSSRSARCSNTRKNKVAGCC